MGKRLNGHSPSVRFVNNLTLYFAAKDEIQAWDDKSYIKVCRPLIRPKGYYAKSWKPLLERLYHNNSLESVRDVALLAAGYDADVYCPRVGPPELPAEILIRPSKFHRGETMGIFKATDTSDYDVVVYSKYCLECDEETSTALATLKSWANREKLEVIVIRTAYRPADHERATDLYGSIDYPAIVVWNDVKALTEFVKMIKVSSNKLIKPEKNKTNPRKHSRFSAKEDRSEGDVEIQDRSEE